MEQLENAVSGLLVAVREKAALPEIDRHLALVIRQWEEVKTAHRWKPKPGRKGVASEEVIRDEFRRGAPVSEIVRTQNVSRATIYRLVDESDIKKRNSTRKLKKFLGKTNPADKLADVIAKEHPEDWKTLVDLNGVATVREFVKVLLETHKSPDKVVEKIKKAAEHERLQGRPKS
ncbi:MAG TPA: hypothetical protein VHR66_20580 [Gemmataceae bacterium]|nr:hypothetical protein [Gemmataceae bacterium]